MTTHAMIDIETLATSPEAVILSVGGVKFDPYTNEEPHSGLYLRLNVDEQSELDRHVDDNTLEWWSKQDAKIREEALGDEDRTTLLDFIKQIEKELGKKGIRNYMPLQKGDVKQTLSDTNLLRKITGYNPKTEYKSGIKKFINWYKDYYKIY